MRLFRYLRNHDSTQCLTEKGLIKGFHTRPADQAPHMLLAVCRPELPVTIH
jgi:hypothetical protein